MARLLALVLMAALLAAGGCGVNTGPGSPTGGGSSLQSEFGGPTGVISSPASTDTTPARVAPGRLGLLARAGGDGVKSLRLGVREVWVRPAQGKWQRLADAAAITKLGPSPAELRGEAARLIALGSLPAGAYEQVRLLLAGGSSLTLAATPGQPMPVVAKNNDLTLPCPAVTVAGGDLKYLLLTIDGTKLQPAGTCLLSAGQVALAEPAAAELGGIAGEVAPPAAVATITARLPSGDALGKATSDPTTGRYTITGLPAGEYSLTVEAPGYRRHQDQSRKIGVKPGEMTAADQVVLEAVAIPSGAR